MKVNEKEVIGIGIAYDGCHKIYVVEDVNDLEQAKDIGYSIYPIDNLPSIYQRSCELRFISNWKLDTMYLRQFEKPVFEN